MERFPELKGLSILIKVNVLLVIVAGLLAALFIDTGWARVGGLVVSLMVALAYWIQARFIDILLQINGNTMDTLAQVRTMLSESRRAATTPAVAARLVLPGTDSPSPPSAVPTTPKARYDTSAATPGADLRERLAVELDPATVAPREQVTIYVSNAHANSSIVLYLVDVAGNVLLKASAWTNADGALRYRMLVPADLFNGTYNVVVRTIGDTSTAELTVTA